MSLWIEATVNSGGKACPPPALPGWWSFGADGEEQLERYLITRWIYGILIKGHIVSMIIIQDGWLSGRTEVDN